jgi:hypothetical protein
MSSEAEATRWLSGEKETALTGPEWPLKIRYNEPVAEVPHTRTVVSFEAEAAIVPSGERATSQTQPEWPSKVRRDTSLTSGELVVGVCIGGGSDPLFLGGVRSTLVTRRERALQAERW